MEIDKKKYEEYVKRITPVHAFWPTLGKAFLTGGLICTLGQFINNWLMNSRGLEQEAAGAWTCLLYTSPSPRDRTRSRMPSSA